ncbi:unnamed protein product [Lactuca virosa]|uniref:RRM domain-containing protein n=1 Tax=Lactuca virosa TaxID=75947 RepID=A0AAU9MJH4_9ASTR|nr:unnamed protein product [Lactuca virosa]
MRGEMKGHLPNGEWTEVRRRRSDNRSQVKNRVTNFYVAGFPDGIKKEELREPFSRFGKVIDVYFGWKKDYQRRNYAFVRFTEVEDAKVLEKKLQGINCRGKAMEINISKHQRKPIQSLGDKWRTTATAQPMKQNTASRNGSY